MPLDNYRQLIERLTTIRNLDRVGELLNWDEETHMPRAAAMEREEQKALIRRLAHETFIDDETGRLLEAAAVEVQGLDYDTTEASVVRVIQRQYTTRRKVPADLVATRRAHSSMAIQRWLEAREANDFRVFAATFTTAVELSREFAAAVGYEEHPYDGFLRWGEPGTSTAGLQTLFGHLRRELTTIVSEIAARPQVDDSFLRQPYDEAAQEELSRWVVARLGYDFSRGGLDFTVHPSIRAPSIDDVRILTRYRPDDCLNGLFATIHESGHAMYEQGIGRDLPGAVWTCGVATGSDDFHESQSRLFENVVCRGRPAWKYFYPKMQETFPSQLGGVSLDRFYAAINKVEPSLIRVAADEATYNLHVILRFEIENDLLEGRLDVADVPEAWRTKMNELLGVRPSNDVEGALQDLHWTFGLGSFHPYTLGNVISAQIWQKCRTDIPDLDDQMAAGDFTRLLDWLRQNIHQHGQKFTSHELLERITGEPLTAQPYVRYLREKFAAIYAVSERP